MVVESRGTRQATSAPVRVRFTIPNTTEAGSIKRVFGGIPRATLPDKPCGQSLLLLVRTAATAVDNLVFLPPFFGGVKQLR